MNSIVNINNYLYHKYLLFVMYFCFADESGDTNIFNQKSRFFLICGMLIHEKYLLNFEEKKLYLINP